MGKSAKDRGVYKRSNSPYWWLEYSDGKGGIIRKSSKTTKKREAFALLCLRRQQALEGKLPRSLKKQKYSFHELADKYLNKMRRQKSIQSKTCLVKQMMRYFGNIPLNRFSHCAVDDFRDAMLDEGKSVATTNRMLAFLCHMFGKAVMWDMVDKEVEEKVRSVKQMKENNQRLRYLTIEESCRLVQNCSHHLRPIVVMALNTGMRKGEILNLKWENVDLQNGLILLSQNQTKNSERKEVHINRALMDELRRLHSERMVGIPYVFVNPATNKKYIDLKHGFRTALRKAGIKDFRFHDLRHTFASHLVMSGVDLLTVKELLGHKSLRMTVRYAHLAPKHKQEAVNKLDEVFSTEIPSTENLNAG